MDKNKFIELLQQLASDDSVDPQQEEDLLFIQKMYSKVGLTLVQTCQACPEQYDVFEEDQPVGYYRLRHGVFRVDYVKDGLNETIYEASPRGDGMFDCDERLIYLIKALRILLKRLDV